MTTPKPVVLCILDGWGLRSETDGNAPALANTPCFDDMLANSPSAQLITHGPDVGLPRGQMGNSEVGHTNIGAGRVVAMDLGQIDLAIEDGSFFENDALKSFCDTLKKSGGTAHIAGLVSDGGVHCHLDHILASVKAVTDAGIPVVVHAMTDGRDVAQKSAKGYLETLENGLPDGTKVATVTGRYFAMDRDNRWNRVEKTYRAWAHADGVKAESAQDAVDAAYANDKTDEFIPATVIAGYAGIQPGDGMFFVNFRADRAREILAALADPSFEAFDITGRPTLSACLGMVDYSDHHTTYMTTAYPKQRIVNTLGAWVASKGLKQFRLAETEKYPHVTFFLNGGVEPPEPGEDRYMPKSPDVATYDLQPEMSAPEVSNEFVEAIKAGYDLIVVNYANPDMVGHTGDLQAAMKACEAVDHGLNRARKAIEKVGGAMIVTADHGNCETMIDPETGNPHTAHTTNPVPVMLIGGPENAQLNDGRLADLAPTLLQLMGLDQPPEMTGKSLIDVS